MTRYLAVVALAACSADPAASTACVGDVWCSGDRVMHCLDGGAAVREDCAASGEMIGVAKTCEVLVAASGPACVDLERESCIADTTRCSASALAYRTCVQTDSGPVFDSRPLSEVCDPGQLCFQANPSYPIACTVPTTRTCVSGTWMFPECVGNSLEICAEDIIHLGPCPTLCRARPSGTYECY